jgi:hypothetical protein
MRKALPAEMIQIQIKKEEIISSDQIKVVVQDA